MKLYFKHEAESEHGAGVAYLEVVDGWPRRQVEVYGSLWRWGDEAHPQYLADQSLEFLGVEEANAISSIEFERVWQEAQERCQLPS